MGQCCDNVKVSLLLWHTLTHFAMQSTRFALALQVQRWTRARSECLPGGGAKIIVMPLYGDRHIFFNYYRLLPLKDTLFFLTFYRALPCIFGVFFSDHLVSRLMSF